MTQNVCTVPITTTATTELLTPPQLLNNTPVADIDPSAGNAFYAYKMDGFLKARNAPTFSTIPNFQEIARLYWFGEFLVRLTFLLSFASPVSVCIHRS
jgi:hypothetical protein